MDELRALLDRASAHIDPVPPAVDALVARRRSQVRTRAAVIITVVCVAAAAVGVAVLARPSHTPPSASGITDKLKDYRWRAMPAAPIVPRTDPATVWTGRQLFVWGGSIGARDFTDGAVYDPFSRTWTSLPSVPRTIHNPIGVLVGDEVLVCGRADACADGGQQFDLRRRQWSSIASPRAVQLTSSPPVVIGSVLRAVLLRVDDTRVVVDAYDPQSGRWHALPSLSAPSGARVSVVAGAGSDHIYVWLGWPSDRRGGSGSAAYRLGDGDRWAEVKAIPGRGLVVGSAQLGGARILLVQQRATCTTICFVGPVQPIAAVAVVDPVTGRRRTVPDGPLGSPDHKVLIWTGQDLLAYDPQAAEPRQSARPGALAVWDASTGRWFGLPTAPVDGAAGQRVTVWTGNELLVWGVVDRYGATINTGGVEFAPH